jgi:hypothetical protein
MHAIHCRPASCRLRHRLACIDGQAHDAERHALPHLLGHRPATSITRCRRRSRPIAYSTENARVGVFCPGLLLAASTDCIVVMLSLKMPRAAAVVDADHTNTIEGIIRQRRQRETGGRQTYK